MSLLVKALHNARNNDACEKESGEIISGDAALHDAGEMPGSSTEFAEAIEAIEKERSVTDEYIERLSLEISELEEDAPVGSGSFPVDTEKDAQSLEIAGESNIEEQVTEGKIGSSTKTLEAFTRERDKARKQRLLVTGAVVLLVLALPVFVIDFSGTAFSSGSTALIATSGDQQMDDAASEELATNAKTGDSDETSAATTSGGPVDTAIGLSVNETGERKVDSAPAVADTATAVAGSVRQSGYAESSGEGYSPIVISKRRAAPTVTQHLREAYQNFQDKNYEAAGKYYQLALDENPGSASALNGLGAIALESGDKSLAEKYFYAALTSDPNSAYAKAALLNLGSDRGSARQEELLMNVVRKNPGDAVAAHVLGQFYAARKEWSKAQGYLFSAFSMDSANADYAFNLAVSLDHLGKVAAAREYYVIALQLTATKPANFSKAAVEQRLLSID